MPSRTSNPSRSATRVLVLYDAGFASVVERHAPGHALAGAAAAFNDAGPIAAALDAEGYRATVRAAPPDPTALASVVRRARPHVVMNLCTTLGGDGAAAVLVPAMLAAMQLPFAGADAAGLALSRRKHDVKAVLSRDGLPTPRYQVIASLDEVEGWHLQLAAPVIVKPTAEHASVGLEQASVCIDEAEVKARARQMFARFPAPLLIEEYVDGRELSVSFAGDPPAAFAPMEHTFEDLPPGYLPLRTFDTKWANDPALSGEAGGLPRLQAGSGGAGAVPLRAPSVPGAWSLDGLSEACRLAFTATGCRDWGRVDLRLDRGGVPLIIDVTPNTWLGESAPCVQAAAAQGWHFGALVSRIVEGALARGMSVAHDRVSRV